MIDILAVGSAASFATFTEEILRRDDTALAMVDSGADALDMLKERHVDLVVIDELLKEMSGLDLARQVAGTWPMVSVALVSPAPPEVFHESTEGLGLLAQLSAPPGAEEAKGLLEKLDRILRMAARAGGAS